MHQPPSLNLAELIENQQANHSLALTSALGDLSYAQLYTKIAGARERLTGNLAELELEVGDRVALMMPNIPAMPVYYYALLSLGLICVPLNPLLSQSEVQYQLTDSGSKLLIAWDGSRVLSEKASFDGVEIFAVSATAELPDSPERWESTPTQATDPAVILYTSGTTGKPKGATLTHANMWANATTVAKVFEYTDQDVFFGGLPLFHSFGQTVSMNAAFAAGASVALLPRFAPEAALQLCRDTKVSIIAAVPSMYVVMAAYLEENPADDLRGKIRYGISGGSALAAATHADFEGLLDCPILEGYGLSETAPVVSFNQPKYEPVIGSVGRVIEGVHAQVRDEEGRTLPAGERGQLWVKGPNVMAGYWNLPAETQAVFDGDWFATGDVAQMDQTGNIFIVDRLKDMILRNGYSVYPREIEDLIHTHPQVRMVAVVGRQDDRVGEEIYALVVPKDATMLTDLQGQEVLVNELTALCKERLAAYKYPRVIELRAELPLGATGKILKKDLR